MIISDDNGKIKYDFHNNLCYTIGDAKDGRLLHVCEAGLSYTRQYNSDLLKMYKKCQKRVWRGFTDRNTLNIIFLKLNKVKEDLNVPFTEICIYQVKPQKVEEFEALMLEAKSFLEKQEGLLLLRLVKRGYHIDMEQIREGLPPLQITRIVKSVKYMLYWEFDTKESYGAAQKNLYDSYWKSIEKCLIVPHDKYLGESVF